MVKELSEGGADVAEKEPAQEAGTPAPAQENAVADVDAKPPAKTGGLSSTALALMKKHRGKATTFRADEVAIPRLYILQDLSPQVKPGHAEFIAEAKPGMLFNSVLGLVGGQIDFIPTSFATRFVMWKPRKQGGGLIDPDVPRSALDSMEQQSIGRWVCPDPDPERGGIAEVIETPEWIGLQIWNGKVTPVVISFPSTKAKVSKRINALVSMQEEIDDDGEVFTPPAFANVFRLKTGMEYGEGDQSWWGFVPSYLGRVGQDSLIERAAKLYEQFESGEVDTAPPVGDEQG